MREPPADLAGDTLRACLRDQYQLAVDDLTFLPLGHDSSAWVYQARTADDRAYVLKVRTRVANEAGLLVPRHLHGQGIKRVAAPLPTTAGHPWAKTAGYALILYPFIEGATGMERGMTDQQWLAYGALLRRVHETTITPDLARVLPRETYTPVWASMVRRLDDDILARTTFANPAERALATFWRARREEILLLLARSEGLGRRLARTTPTQVLCHADIHTANVLLDPDGQVWFVDWDETTLAPRERDLMFVAGGISRRLVGPREEALFFQSYGVTTTDPLALAYYRYAWAVNDIGAYGEQVFFRPDLGPISKREGAEGFQSLFRNGEIVALAFASGAGMA